MSEENDLTRRDGDMTINEIIEMKNDVERKILQLMIVFSNETKTQIDYINFETIKSLNGDISYFRVKLDIKL